MSSSERSDGGAAPGLCPHAAVALASGSDALLRGGAEYERAALFASRCVDHSEGELGVEYVVVDVVEGSGRTEWGEEW